MIVFLKEALKTVQSKISFEIENIDLFLEDLISYKFDENIEIEKMYYRKNNELTVIQKVKYDGDDNSKLKTFQTAVTIEMTFKGAPLKLRFFYTKHEKTFQISNGFEIEDIEDILIKVSEWIKTKYTVEYKLRYIIYNGVAQTQSLNLIELSSKLTQNANKFLYTPSRSASLKIYNDLGTSCVFSTGKILYMGTKNKVCLMGLHEEMNLLFKKLYSS
jgi:hypothetical protein